MNEKKRLVLIDGYSLLNRAFYAMNIFTTKDGMPTNGIFGFVKLLFKIVEDISPEYLIVAFDVHAPTFRHKMYDGYKATRKPMPEELMRQVPVLKELLAAMRICTAELSGFEADDIIGTLSRAYEGVEVYIYTGDRDAYQLVKEDVSVCFTRRGVSDLEILTAENFTEKVGLEPWQIVEEKALMGDKADNIPGVAGIGPKGAMQLLGAYRDLDGIYAHLDEIASTMRKKLEACKETAYLSQALARIDLAVPISVPLESARLTLPFPEEAREYFSRLEFRSLVDGAYFNASRPVKVEVCYPSAEDFLATLPEEGEFAFCMEKQEYHVFLGGKENIFRLRTRLFEVGYFPDELKPVLTRLFTGKLHAVVPDLKALSHQLAEVGVRITCPVDDVSLLRYLGDSNLRPTAPSQLVKDYALSEDCCACAVMRAYEDAVAKTKGTAEETLYHEIELPLVNVLFGMEQAGVCVDTEKFPEFSARFNEELEALSHQIYELAGVDSFNINSPFQLSEVLYRKLGIEPKGAKRNAKGGYSTGADVLEKLAEQHEIVRLILRYREIQKLLSTYIDGIRPLVVGGMVHTTYNQTATTTGRLSSANPNLQNIPVRTEMGRELRKLFVAREGNVLVDADYSQIELRLLAHFSGCKALIEAYNNGEDVHASTAARVFGVPLQDVTPVLRRRAKTINFGIIYGMSGFGLAKDLGCSNSEAQSYIDKYFLSHPEVKEYMEGNVRFAKENGYVTTVLGRKRYIPELRSANWNERSFGERAAMNMPLQGSAADLIKIAMLHVATRLWEEKLQTKMVLQVHDELILDAPKEEEARAAVILKEEMEHAIALRVPLVAEVSSGRSWYDAK